MNQFNQIVIAITIEENPELAMTGLMRGAFKELNQQHGPNSKHRGFFSQRLSIPMILTLKRKSHQVICMTGKKSWDNVELFSSGF